MSLRPYVAYTLAGALSLVGANARAEVAADSAKAEALFREATRLLTKKQYPEACVKFAESKRLEPGIGVTLYLGDCYERVGRTASAWAEFSAAEDAANLAHDARAHLAHERAVQVEQRLSKVIIVVAHDADVDGLEVKQDGIAVGRAQWAIALPVDPGDRHFDATAPGRRSWEQRIHVGEGPLTVTVNVPALVPEPSSPIEPATARVEPTPPSAATPPPAQREKAASGGAQRTFGIAAMSAGLAAVGAGALFGLAAKSKLDDSNTSGQCNASDHCDAAGLAMRSDGVRDATISTVAFGVGAGALLGGALLYLTAPHAKVGTPSPVDVSAALAPGGGNVTAAVRF